MQLQDHLFFENRFSVSVVLCPANMSDSFFMNYLHSFDNRFGSCSPDCYSISHVRYTQRIKEMGPSNTAHPFRACDTLTDFIASKKEQQHYVACRFNLFCQHWMMNQMITAYCKHHSVYGIVRYEKWYLIWLLISAQDLNSDAFF